MDFVELIEFLTTHKDCIKNISHVIKEEVLTEHENGEPKRVIQNHKICVEIENTCFHMKPIIISLRDK